MTVNRFCSSGLQTVAMAADRIRLGEADVMIAGGTETMTMVPMMGHKVAMNPKVFEDDNIAIAYGMGITAEKVSENTTSRAKTRISLPTRATRKRSPRSMAANSPKFAPTPSSATSPTSIPARSARSKP